MDFSKALAEEAVVAPATGQALETVAVIPFEKEYF